MRPLSSVTYFDLTDRRFDSAHRAGKRLYITASALILLAREHQFLLAKAMVGPHAVGVYPHATLNLIRPAFEAALTALWILDPDDSQGRILRGLRQCWEDHRQSDSWAEEMLGSPLATREAREAVFAKKAQIAKRYHEDAAHLGIKWDKVRQRINLVDEIKTLSVVQGGPGSPAVPEGGLAPVVRSSARSFLRHPAQWTDNWGDSDTRWDAGANSDGRRVAPHRLPHLCRRTGMGDERVHRAHAVVLALAHGLVTIVLRVEGPPLFGLLGSAVVK